MDKEKLNGLLDSIYELEGLVHLALGRDDCPSRLPELIVSKGRNLAALAQSFSDDAVSPGYGEPQQEDDGSPLYVVDGAPEDDMDVCGEGEVSPEIAQNVIPESYGDDILSGDRASAAAVVPADEDMPIDEDMQSVVEAVFGGIGESIIDDEPVAAVAAQGDVARREPRGRLVFSINDRYRFKRELFSNSDADFNNTLAFVASMDNFEEADDYFTGELQWDRNRAEVADFLDILKKYFKE